MLDLTYIDDKANVLRADGVWDDTLTYDEMDELKSYAEDCLYSEGF